MKFAIFSKKRNIFYAVFILLTVLLTSGLFTWTFMETVGEEVILYDARLQILDTVITEYIAGETVNTDGVKMFVGGEEVEFTAEADLSTAGIKEVRLVYEDDLGKHVANYPVNVYSIKHFDVRSFPRIIYKLRNGFVMEGLTVWAALSDDIYSERFMLTPENPNWYNTVLLTNDVYSLDYKEDEKTGIVTTTVKIGKYTDVSFKSYIAEGGFSIDRVGETISVMPLYNQDDGSSDRLTLFINSATICAAGSGRKMEASGVYVYERRSDSGTIYEYYDFSYWMDEGWGSHFVSPGIQETLAEDTVNYYIDINGESFTAVGSEWRSAFIIV